MKNIFIVKKSFKERFEQRKIDETNETRQNQIDAHAQKCENTINEIIKNGTPEKIDIFTDKEINTIELFAKQVLEGKSPKQAQIDTKISLDLLKRSNILQFLKKQLKK